MALVRMERIVLVSSPIMAQYRLAMAMRIVSRIMACNLPRASAIPVVDIVVVVVVAVVVDSSSRCRYWY